MILKIAIGSDHRGFDLKQKIMMGHKEYAWVDVGCHGYEPVDYPDFAHKVCNLIFMRQVDYAILLCGTGVGMSIAANRYPGIYAALCWTEGIAQQSKEDDNANVLVLPADSINEEQAFNIIKAWFAAKFKEGIYRQRIEKIEKF